MDEAPNWFKKGVALYEKGDYRRAITAFDKTIAIDPTMAEVWNNRGLALVQTEQYQEALLSINKALSINPNYENAKKAKKIVLDLLKDLQNVNNAPGPAGSPLPPVPWASARKHSKIFAATIIVLVLIVVATGGLMLMKSMQNNAGTTLPTAPTPEPAIGPTAVLTTPAIPTTAQLPASGPGDIPPGKGQFVFNDSLGNSDRPITVYTYRPAAWNQSGPILIVMPGAGRTGQSPRDTWVPYAEEYDSLVLVPEFSQEYFPGDMWYPLGYIYGSTNWEPKANWTYMAIEHLFDYVREETGATQETYLLDGHSAGGQFVHRLVTFLPDARYSKAVAANAGLYVMPDYTIPYPLGLKDSPLPESELAKVFSRKLIIMSGSSDTNPKDSSLANFPAAEAEGSTRFARAQAYYASAQAQAAALGVPLNWEYHIVPGVGHDEAGMAGPSAEMLFNES
ncbi:MAG: tetratricopeptide repeat protein [Methanoregula sp.]|jgi:tetratricopeptide (TPR) repeat protein|uniref:tetratricopeptide repeat protein n=1 Tax=Methanoregula sp. TaxID=2052170 RepID=UPI003C1C9330